MPSSPERRTAAMAAAAAVRKCRAEVLAGLTAGDMTLAGVLDLAGSDERVATIKVLKVVEALPGARKVTSRRLLASLCIGETTRLGALGDAERPALIDAFGER